MPVNNFIDLARIAMDSLDKKTPLVEIERSKATLQQQLRDLDNKENLLKLRALTSRLHNILAAYERNSEVAAAQPVNLTEQIQQLTGSIVNLEGMLNIPH